MVRKPPKIPHVKHVKRGQKWYSYFNTGQRKDGKPIYARLPELSSAGFWDSYASYKAGRTKRAAAGEYTVSSLAADYLNSAEYADKAENTRNNYRVQIERIKGVWGAFPVNALEPFRVRQVLEAESWGAGTRNMVIAVLAVIYKWGRRNNRTTVDPVKDIDRYEVGEHDPWPEDVLEAGLASDDPTVRLAVHLLYFTGQRIGDVMKMRWGDIRGGYIYVKQTKTKKIVEPPLSAELKAELDRTPKTAVTIVTGINEGQLRRKLQAFTAGHGVKTVPHGLRKNAVNALLEAGCTIAEVSAITGQTHQVVEHYAAKVNRKKLGGAAIYKLDSARGKTA